MNQIYVDERMFTLYRDTHGRYWLEVISGGIAMFPVAVLLDAQTGASFVDDREAAWDLAYRVARSPEEYSTAEARAEFKALKRVG